MQRMPYKYSDAYGAYGDQADPEQRQNPEETDQQIDGPPPVAPPQPTPKPYQAVAPASRRTFSQLQAAGEARPPMPDNAGATFAPQPVTSQAPPAMAPASAQPQDLSTISDNAKQGLDAYGHSMAPDVYGNAAGSANFGAKPFVANPNVPNPANDAYLADLSRYNIGPNVMDGNAAIAKAKTMQMGQRVMGNGLFDDYGNPIDASGAPRSAENLPFNPNQFGGVNGAATPEFRPEAIPAPSGPVNLRAPDEAAVDHGGITAGPGVLSEDFGLGGNAGVARPNSPLTPEVFRDLQTAQGNAGVAPAPAGSTITSQAPTVGGAPVGSAAQPGQSSDILQMLLGGANAPGAYGTDQVKSSYDWLGGQIDDQYAQREHDLRDELGRRGLSDSTGELGLGGRLQDLNIGRRSAKESLAYDLGDKQASQGNAAQQNRLQWLQSLMGYGQQGFNNDLATGKFNQDQQQNYQDWLLKLLGLGYGGAGA